MLLRRQLPPPVTAPTLLLPLPWHRDTAWLLLLPPLRTEEEEEAAAALEALEVWVAPVDTTPWPWPTTIVSR